MKTNMFVSATFAVLLSAASLSAMASTGRHTPLYGEPVPAASAERTITITPATKYVNVKAGEIVQFVVNGQSTTWSFDNPVKYEVKLRKIMPQVALDHKVMVYIARNPDYHAN